MYKFVVTTALCALLAGLLAACGSQEAQLDMRFAPVTVDSHIPGIEYEYAPGPDGEVRRQVRFTYSRSGFPAAESFTVVPLDSGLQPSLASAGKLSIALEQDGAARKLKLSANGATAKYIHLHFDPAQWEVQGVGVLNPYGPGTQFLQYTSLPQPGLLEICYQPLGGASALLNGDLAQIELARKGRGRQASLTAPTGSHQMTVAYFMNGNPPVLRTFGNVDLRLDGTYGDAASKDGWVDGAELNPSTAYRDNHAHDAELAGFGVEAGWNGTSFAQFDPQTHVLSWRENLPGDYSNDGQVYVYHELDALSRSLMYDFGGAQSPSHMQGEPPTRQQSQGRIFELDSTLIAPPGEPSTFWRMMDDPFWLKQQTPTPTHVVKSYYIFDADPLPQDGGATHREFSDYAFDFTSFGNGYGASDVRNALDGFRDGYVYDYLNWDATPDPNNIPDAYASVPGPPGSPPFWGVPGDTLPIYYHSGEMISGYQAWTVLHSDGASFNPNSPPVSAKPIRLAASNPQQWATVLTRELYPDKPWTLALPEKYRKAEITSLPLQITDFYRGANNETGGTYDIIIAPFADIPGGSRVFSTSRTRLENAVALTPAASGPQYRIPVVPLEGGVVDETVPAYNSADRGIVSIGGVRDLTIRYHDAEFVDNWMQWAEEGDQPSKRLYYQLFVNDDPATPTDPEEYLFTNPKLTKTWYEGQADIDNVTGNSDAFNESLRLREVRLSFEDGDVDFSSLHHSIWFGIRVVDSEGNIVEYSTPSGHLPYNMIPFKYSVPLPPLGPQYVVDSNTYSGGDPVGRAAERGSVWPQPAIYGGISGAPAAVKQLNSNLLSVEYNVARQVDWLDPNALPAAAEAVWGAPEVEYRLYASTSALLTDIRSGTPIATWVAGTVQSPMPEKAKTEVILTSQITLERCRRWYFYIEVVTPPTSIVPGIREYQGVFPYSNAPGDFTLKRNDSLNFAAVADDIEAPQCAVYGGLAPQPAPTISPINEPLLQLPDHIVVMLNPAIDFPARNLSEPLTYRCYYSSRSWASGLPADVGSYVLGQGPKPADVDELPPLVISYLDATGLPRDRDAFSFVTDEYLGNSLQFGVQYWFYVQVIDNACTVNLKGSYPRSAQLHAEDTSAIDLAQHVGMSVNFVGDLVADSTGSKRDLYAVYAPGITVYPPAGNDGEWSVAQVSYIEIHNTQFPVLIRGQDIFSTSSYKLNTILSGAGQLKLDFHRDQLGHPVQVGGRRRPVVSAVGRQRQEMLIEFEKIYDVLVAGDQGTGAWSVERVAQVDDPWKLRDAANITSYQWLVERDNTVQTLSTFYLPWGNSISYFVPGQPLHVTGLPGAWGPSLTITDSGLFMTGSGVRISSDIVTRTLGIAPGVGSSSAQAPTSEDEEDSPDPVNMLFMLIDSYNTSTQGFSPVELYCGTGWPLAFDAPVRLHTQSPFIDNGAPGSRTNSLGPNSLAAVRSTVGGEVLVYVAYCDSPSDFSGGSPPPSDGRGLKVAMATYAGAGIGNFVLDPTASLIDDDYISKAGDTIPTFDVLDLQVRPEFGSGADPWEGLGCVYISQGGRLYYRETVKRGLNYVWDAPVEIFATDGIIDVGRFRWAKLAYVYDGTYEGGPRSIPYVLYGVRQSINDNDNNIRLWRLGGWI